MDQGLLPGGGQGRSAEAPHWRRQGCGPLEGCLCLSCRLSLWSKPETRTWASSSCRAATSSAWMDPAESDLSQIDLDPATRLLKQHPAWSNSARICWNWAGRRFVHHPSCPSAPWGWNLLRPAGFEIHVALVGFSSSPAPSRNAFLYGGGGAPPEPLHQGSSLEVQMGGDWDLPSGGGRLSHILSWDRTTDVASDLLPLLRNR